jgi:hypothetical protein
MNQSSPFKINLVMLDLFRIFELYEPIMMGNVKDLLDI